MKKLHNRTPDIEQLYRVLRREIPQRPTLFELFLNDPLCEWLTERPKPVGHLYEHIRFLVQAFGAAGYDYATFSAPWSFVDSPYVQKHTRSSKAGGLIRDWASFEAYPWPDPSQVNLEVLEQIRPELPGNMRLSAMGPHGVLQNAIRLMGDEALGSLLLEDPALVAAVFDRIGGVLLAYYRQVLQYDSVGLIVCGDAWGFHPQDLLSPEELRHYAFPWHRRIVAAAHEAGKPAVLCAGGYAGEVMEDILAIGFDGKHSYQDQIQPVEAAYDQWHDRIAILGGMDVDFLMRATPGMIRGRCHAMLDKTASTGGYALGSGSSIPDDLPLGHYWAMNRAALEMG